MFLFTKEYFTEVVLLPGGMADYIGRFLTQFFLFPWAGALILALLFAGLQLLTFSQSKARCQMDWVLSFIPAGLLTLYMAHSNALPGAFVAAIIGMASAKSVTVFRNSIVKCLIAILQGAVIYFLCGNLGVIFLIAGVVARKENWLSALLIAVAALACTFASRGHFGYPFSRLLVGIHYNRYHDSIPLLALIAGASAVIVEILGIMTVKISKKLYHYLSFAVIVLGLGFGFYSSRETDWEEVMKYTILTQEGEWDKILKSATKRVPASPVAYSSMNLALARKNLMGEWMFRMPQIGPDGVFYPFRREHISPLGSSMVYWYLGLLNTSQRFTFTAQEVIQDFQKSSWCHKRLTEIYMVDGNYLVSRKHLEPLKYTLFYRSWAKKTEKLLDNPALIDQDKEYKAIRDNMMTEHSYLYSVQALYEPLHLLSIENRNNTMSYQYLMGWALINCDLDTFAQYLEPERFKTLPRSYQEAYLLYWSRDHESPEGMLDVVSDAVMDRFNRFMTDFSYSNENVLRSKYYDTYWYYYFTHAEE